MEFENINGKFERDLKNFENDKIENSNVVYDNNCDFILEKDLKQKTFKHRKPSVKPFSLNKSFSMNFFQSETNKKFCGIKITRDFMNSTDDSEFILSSDELNNEGNSNFNNYLKTKKNSILSKLENIIF